MSASTTYTPFRDDTGHRSLSNNERTFLHSCATGQSLPSASAASSTSTSTSTHPPNPSSSHGTILRTDGRSPGESRPIRLTYTRSHNLSECSVQLGANTRVSSVVTCHLIPPPHADRPNDGSITFSVDLSPMACMGFEYVQPASTLAGGGRKGMGQALDERQKLLSNRILRILERTLLNGGAIDAEALCVESGKWVWRLHVDVTVLDHGGNLVDACVLSAVAALRHFRKPEVDVASGDDGGTVGAGPVVCHSDEREPTPLPLHHTPLTVTFALYSDPSGATTKVSALIDPTFREELVMNGTSTFSFNKYGELCSLDFPGGCELKPSQLIMCSKLGKQKCVELCDVLEKSLSEANEKAAVERMERLRRSTGFGNGKLPIPEVATNTPFMEGSQLMEVDQEDLSQIGSKQADTAAVIAAAEEESYRIQALDYAQGHVAAKVKENENSRKHEGARRSKGGGPIFGGSLMSAMLKSAGNVEESSTQIQLEKEQKNEILPSDTGEADSEDDNIIVVKEEKKTQAEPTQVVGHDSDEEVDTVMLHSEFGSVSVADESKEVEQKERKKKQKTHKPRPQVDSDDDVDLSMAIKKKKSKKSKKKK